MQETLINIAAYIFLLGVVLVFISVVPAVRRRAPRSFMVGFLLSVLAIVMVLLVGVFVR